MPLFQSGQSVKLSQYTGDDQIDFYYGIILEVVEYTPIRHREPDGTSGEMLTMMIPNYTLVAPDGIVISANEYELKPVVRRRNRRKV